MRNFLAASGAAATLALFSAPAAAVTPQPQATATARILRPLTIDLQQNLDFGNLILSGGTFAGQLISMSQSGVLTGCGTNVACSGSPAPARYKLTGTNNAVVTITCPGFNLTGPGPALAFTPNAPATVNLGANGTSGVIFGIGGSITLSSTTADGVYSGNFLVTADYQ